MWYLKVKPQINKWKNELNVFAKYPQCTEDKKDLKLFS